MREAVMVLAVILAAACTTDPAATAGAATTAPQLPSAAPTATSLPSEEPRATASAPTKTLAPGQTPGPTVIDLLPLLSSEITVANLADEALTLRATLVDTESSQEFEVAAVELQPFQVTTQSILPARFRLEFEFGGSANAATTCTIDIGDGEALQFAVLETGIALTSSTQTEPAGPTELLVATASRCKAGGGA